MQRQPSWSVGNGFYIKKIVSEKLLTVSVKTNQNLSINLRQQYTVFSPLFTATCQITWTFHFFGREQKQIHWCGNNTRPRVFSLTLESYQCPLWHHKEFKTFWKVEQAKEVKDRLMSILGISQTVTVDRNMLFFADKYAISCGENNHLTACLFLSSSDQTGNTCKSRWWWLW